jgi:hypothetical protein
MFVCVYVPAFAVLVAQPIWKVGEDEDVDDETFDTLAGTRKETTNRNRRSKGAEEEVEKEE